MKKRKEGSQTLAVTGLSCAALSPCPCFPGVVETAASRAFGTLLSLRRAKAIKEKSRWTLAFLLDGRTLKVIGQLLNGSPYRVSLDSIPTQALACWGHLFFPLQCWASAHHSVASPPPEVSRSPWATPEWPPCSLRTTVWPSNTAPHEWIHLKGQFKKFYMEAR